MEKSIREWQVKFKNGDYDKADVETQCDAGWYDWFCKDSSLARKTKMLGKAVAQLKDSKRVNLDTMYVFFKNNCPLCGPLYDDFRICDIETGAVLYCISYKNPHYKEKMMWNVAAIVEEKKKDSVGWIDYNFNTTKKLVEWLNEK